MKIKNKGKVHPSPSSSSSAAAAASHPPCSGAARDVPSVMKLLPAAILALASVLSLEDREVLAYMITRSLDTAAPAAAGGPGRKRPQPSRRGPAAAASPSFDCDCFDCYMSYWHRWDSSPNQELIDQAIEAFEDHLASGELSKSKNGGGRGKAKRRERDSRMARGAASGKPEPEPEPQMPVIETATPSEAEDTVAASPETEVLATPVTSPERAGTEKLPEEAELSCQLPAAAPAAQVAAQSVDDAAARRPPAAAASSHKGLARKVLPDVLGILNSRLWSLWSPNV
ncbi:uncharacterized protein LOC115680087 [Syzygium oleosum]|uniref:uncharacterized protein LOC115680087 n=1 Tax=Syzygium oleosum TaxID=219896 RepID=UPI0011D29C92|nr:uncharacterized protein LOC115680087 [Syzygium oleosum]